MKNREYHIVLGRRALQALDEALVEVYSNFKSEYMEQETQTLGEARVRLSFNPSNEGPVEYFKKSTAILIDALDTMKEETEAFNGEKTRLISLAQTAYEEAAMWAVKAATYEK